MSSVWIAGAQPGSRYPMLTGTLNADVVVIGAGITGLMTALLLHESGRRVIVLEADRIGRGNTGRSTGNLYATVSGGLATLRSKWKRDAVAEVVGVRRQALDLIEQTVHRFAIECAFARRPLYRAVATDPGRLGDLDDEFAACLEAGLPASLQEGIDGLAWPLRRVLRLDQQAQFDPLQFCTGLAQALQSIGSVTLHEGSVVRQIDAGRGHVATDDGEVHAGTIVFASHVPKGFNLVQAEMLPFREHAVAARLRSGRFPDGIVWLLDRQRSLRSHRHGGRDYVLAIGERHKVGSDESAAGRERLARELRAQFDVEQITHQWTAQQYRPADGLPYIGPSAHGNVYMATGFAADGLIWGTVAARLIAAQIDGHRPHGSDLLTPRRFTPVKSARVWVSENREVVSRLVADRLGSAEHRRLAEIAPGEGGIVELDGRRHAVYRSPENRFVLLSPACTHMGCHVQWNATDHSWDCPCHGSRFQPDGRVIEGPALAPLEQHAMLSGAEGLRPLPVKPPLPLQPGALGNGVPRSG